MFDINKAYRFIKENGSAIEVARLNSIVDNLICKEYIIEKLKEYQGSDGGFVLEKGRNGNLSDTEYILTWLWDLNLLESDISKSSFAFIEKRQQVDGSFTEIDLSRKKNKPEWMRENQSAVLFQTANTMFWLCKYSKNQKAIEKGYEYLESRIIKDNNYIHTKWLAACALSSKYSWNDHNVNMLIDNVYDKITSTIPSSVITWMLWSLYVYEKPMKNNEIEKMLEFIKQEEDGGIISEDGDKYRVNATIEATKVIKLYNYN